MRPRSVSIPKMLYMTFCGWAWAIAVPGGERRKIDAVTVFFNVAGLFAFVGFCSNAAPPSPLPAWAVIFAGWLASALVGFPYYRRSPALPVLAKAKANVYARIPSWLPFIAAVSLVPCLAIQLPLLGLSARTAEFAFREFGMACVLLVVDMAAALVGGFLRE